MASLKPLSDSTNITQIKSIKSLDSMPNTNFLKKIPIVRKTKSSSRNQTLNTSSCKEDVCDPNEEFYPPSQHLKSWIWKYLLVSSSGRHVKCRICNLVYSRIGGSTTGLGRHISRSKQNPKNSFNKFLFLYLF